MCNDYLLPPFRKGVSRHVKLRSKSFENNSNLSCAKAESPDEVAAAITAAESTAKQQRLSHPSPPLSDQHSEQPISDVEKMELLALQELIRKRLDRFCGGG